MTEKNIEISVAIAIYNIDKYLRKCLESLKQQDYNACEYILVDDGSTDLSGTICDEYVLKDDRFRVIHKKNEGLVSARRVGLENARGKYIYFIDGDDWLGDGVISNLMKRIKYNANLFVFPYYMSYEFKEQRVDNSYTGLITGESLALFKKEFISKGKLYHFGITPAVWNKIYERERVKELYKKIPNDITIGEDFALTIPYIMECNSILFIDFEQAYHYQIRNDSMTHKYDSKLVDKITNLKKYFDTLELTPEISNQMDKYWAMITTMLIENQMIGSIKFSERKNAVMKIYEIPGLLEAVSRVAHCDYTWRFKMLLYPFLCKNYAELLVMHYCDASIRKMFSFGTIIKKFFKINGETK